MIYGFVTEKILRFIILKKMNLNIFFYPETQRRESTRNYIPVIYEDKNTNIWLGYRDGLAIFNKKKK